MLLLLAFSRIKCLLVRPAPHYPHHPHGNLSDGQTYWSTALSNKVGVLSATGSIGSTRGRNSRHIFSFALTFNRIHRSRPWWNPRTGVVLYDLFDQEVNEPCSSRQFCSLFALEEPFLLWAMNSTGLPRTNGISLAFMGWKIPMVPILIRMIFPTTNHRRYISNWLRHLGSFVISVRSKFAVDLSRRIPFDEWLLLLVWDHLFILGLNSNRDQTYSPRSWNHRTQWKDRFSIFQAFS